MTAAQPQPPPNTRPARGVEINEFWMESNDADELRAGCDCGWLGEWRDFGRDAANDGDKHLDTAHPHAPEAS